MNSELDTCDCGDFAYLCECPCHFDTHRRYPGDCQCVGDEDDQWGCAHAGCAHGEEMRP